MVSYIGIGLCAVIISPYNPAIRIIIIRRNLIFAGVYYGYHITLQIRDVIIGQGNALHGNRQAVGRTLGVIGKVQGIGRCRLILGGFRHRFPKQPAADTDALFHFCNWYAINRQNINIPIIL